MSDGTRRHLLAKGIKQNRPKLSLEQHLRDTDQAILALFGPERRWAHAITRFFKLEGKYETFLLNLRVAGLFHDVGKANEDFQQALISPGLPPQLIRHEHISALILNIPEVREWLQQHPELDVNAVASAVLSHHIKAGSPDDQYYVWCQPRSNREILKLYLDDEQVQATMRRIAQLIGSKEFPKLPRDPLVYENNSWSSPWGEALQSGWTNAQCYRRELQKDPHLQQLLLALKTCLIAADSVASAMFREQISIEKWVNQVMGKELSPQDVQDAIINPRLKSISQRLGKPVHLKDFQKQVAQLGSRVLLLAACGVGKTMAAWAWATEQMAQHRLGRVIFLYPTRGTATEGFRDYVGWAPEGEGSLIHGSAVYELQEMARNPPESVQDKDIQDESAQRLFSLGYWPKRYFSATADQFLSFLEGKYGGICMVPLLADAVLIVDEVHSYDAHMFRTLLAYLKHSSGPVLCMTATLPSKRKKTLEQAGLVSFPPDQNRSELEELEAAEKKIRYRLEYIDAKQDALDEVICAYKDGLRVLYVLNTVQRCQETAVELDKQIGSSDNIIVYHSRFRLMDRKIAHEKTISAFQHTDTAVIAVTTQVCEMSLDIDADILITEIAPITSLVQRFGRANRKGLRPYARLLVLPTSRNLPYTCEQIGEAETFLRALQSKTELSQRDLSEEIMKQAKDSQGCEDYSSLVNHGYYALPGNFRDINEELSCTAILDSDISNIQHRIQTKKSIDAYLLPVPRNTCSMTDAPDNFPTYLSIVPSTQYSQKHGFYSHEG